MVLVVVFVAFPPVFVRGRGVGLETVGVFHGHGGRVGGQRYHIGSPNVKSYRLSLSKTDLLTISDCTKRKGKGQRKMLIGNEPHCFPGN